MPESTEEDEEPEEADKLVKAVFKTAWKQLLKRSDQELGQQLCEFLWSGLRRLVLHSSLFIFVLGFADSRTRTDLQQWLKRSYKEIHQSLQEDIEEA